MLFKYFIIVICKASGLEEGLTVFVQGLKFGGRAYGLCSRPEAWRRGLRSVFKAWSLEEGLTVCVQGLKLGGGAYGLCSRPEAWRRGLRSVFKAWSLEEGLTVCVQGLKLGKLNCFMSLLFLLFCQRLVCPRYVLVGGLGKFLGMKQRKNMHIHI